MKDFIYLIQGKKENVLKYAALQNSISDLCVCTFDEEIFYDELNATHIIFFPNSTWAEGRNKQLAAAKLLKNNYLYYIFLDDDAEFLKGNFQLFEKELLKYKPAIGLPLTTIIKNTNRYNPELEVQHPFAFDQIVQAYHYSVVEDEICVPFITDFDKESWWYSCQINEFLAISKYRGHIIQFNDFLVENTGHVWDEENQVAKDAKSNYKGGVTKQGLQRIREYIEHTWGQQPKLKNTLFHDCSYKESKSGMGRFNWNRKYPSHLVINESEFIGYGIKLPVSVFVVSKNEGHLLENCLNSISKHCDETIVVDLKSVDNTIMVARRYKAKVLSIDPVPLVEIIHAKYIKEAKNSWVLICDPDEKLSLNLVWKLEKIFRNHTEELKSIGEISSPWLCYFKGKRLKGTIWGGTKFRTLLVHKDRFRFTDLVHRGRILLDGYKKLTISEDNDQHVNHYWMQTYTQLFTKHIRYLKNEGKAKYENGEVTDIGRIIKVPFKTFKVSYFKEKGYKDGIIGLFLSIFAAWYFTSAEMELYLYTKNRKIIND